MSAVLPMPKRFVIVASGRTGSHLLADLLDRQRGVRCEGEILERPVMIPEVVLNGRACMARKTGFDAYGFKLHLNQVTVVQSLLAERWFESLVDSGWTILHLYRSNILHQAISAQRAWRTQFHYEADSLPRFEAVEVDPVAILATMSFIEDNLRRTREALAGRSALEIEYSHDLATEEAQRRTLLRVSELLDIEPEWTPSRYVRVQPTSAREMLSNYDELDSLLSETRYAQFLDDRVIDLNRRAPCIPDFPGQAPHGVAIS